MVLGSHSAGPGTVELLHISPEPRTTSDARCRAAYAFPSPQSNQFLTGSISKILQSKPRR